MHIAIPAGQLTPHAPLLISNEKSDRTSSHQQRKERSHLLSSATKRAIAPPLISNEKSDRTSSHQQRKERSHPTLSHPGQYLTHAVLPQAVQLVARLVRL
ncbi:MAG: hypothetical protein F6K28_28910 [Microcoleus sp. SIO2G3]|nr:hypothetical protein [Microcoleus sp. SIO2G3]